MGCTLSKSDPERYELRAGPGRRYGSPVCIPWYAGTLRLAPWKWETRDSPVARMDLLQACAQGHVDVVRALVEAGGDAAQANPDVWTLLHCAALRGHLACVQYLLSLPGAAATLGIMNRDGLSAVAVAARAGYVEVVRALVEAGSDAIQAGLTGWTPLHLAAQSGHLACVQYLLSLPGAATELGAVSHGGSTAVALAAHSGHVHVVRALVEAGSNPAQADANGWTLLHRAALRGHLAHVQYLLSLPGAVATLGMLNRDGLSAVAVAACEGHVDVVTALVEAGSDAAQPDAWTPLHCAALRGHLACVQYLLSLPGAAAVRDVWTPRGSSAVAVAAHNGHVNVVRALVEAGSDAAQAGLTGWTPLHWAAVRGRLACVQYLLSLPGAAADMGAVTHGGSTAMALAAREGRVEVVRALVEAGSDAAQVDAYGWTPLHWAAHRGHLLCAEYLLTLLSVDVSARAGDGRTAETAALASGHDAIARVIAEEVRPCADLSAQSRLMSVVNGQGLLFALHLFPPWRSAVRDCLGWCCTVLVMGSLLFMHWAVFGRTFASPLRIVFRQARRRGRWTALRSAWMGVIVIAHTPPGVVRAMLRM
jgi:ankyrin repeat protein